MIRYKNCSDVSVDNMYKAFQEGFVDYIIKINITKEEFEKRFFGAEGNSKEYSFIVFDGEKPIGIMLGGIRNYEGIKTLRCGGLAIHPKYRGIWISKKLFQLHQELAQNNGCSQLFLEVIVGNDRAIAYYNKMGYKKVYDIAYYSNDNIRDLRRYHVRSLEIRLIMPSEYENVCDRYGGHINWQNSFDYLRLSEETYYYGAFIENELIGGISINKSGRISFVYVENKLRRKGIASSLINHAVKELELNMVSTCFSNNGQAFGFISKSGFKQLPLAQYEMYKIL